MSTATLSSDYRIALPEEVRVAMHLSPGQEFELTSLGSVIQLIPKLSPDELHAAVATLRGQVEVVTVGADTPHSEALANVDAIVHHESGIVAAAPPSALVVAVAVAVESSAGVRTLTHDADVVLPADTSGRVLLATILALLRWRSRA